MPINPLHLRLINRRAFLSTTALAFAGPYLSRASAILPAYQVVVFGATPSGIMACRGAAAKGCKVLLIDGPDAFGGMMTNGLGATDHVGSYSAIGDSLNFFNRTGLNFTPSAAMAAFKALFQESGAQRYTGTITAVKLTTSLGNPLIQSVLLDDGSEVSAEQFIDASYEGDLAVMAKVTMDYGREARSTYGESLAGFGAKSVTHSFRPYVNGKLAPYFRSKPTLAIGAADDGVMAYCYRLCLTDDPSDQVAFYKPANYNPVDYAILPLLIETSGTFSPGIPLYDSRKYDRNFDALPGYNWDYPRGDDATRAKISQLLADWQAGAFYFLANDPSLSVSFRDSVRQYGYAASEFKDNHHWPEQLYVREAGRIQGQTRMTQAQVVSGAHFANAAFTWSYALDSHCVQLFPEDEMHATKEGVGGAAEVPFQYQVPIQAFFPLRAECANLSVPVCASFSRVAFSSYRLEMAYMQAGSACGTLAGNAVKHNILLDTATLV